MSKKIAVATAKDVRTFFAQKPTALPKGVTLGKRGRLDPKAVETFNKVSGMVYEEGNRPMETLPFVKISKSGARLSRTVEVPRPVAREFAGAFAGKRGYLSEDAKAFAGQAYADAHGLSGK